MGSGCFSRAIPPFGRILCGCCEALIGFLKGRGFGPRTALFTSQKNNYAITQACPQVLTDSECENRARMGNGGGGWQMIQYAVFGMGFAFAAAVQPGPLQAFFLSEVTRVGWRRTLPAAFCPLLTDIPIALLTLLVLKEVPGEAQTFIRLAGGLFLLYLAWVAFRDWRKNAVGVASPKGAAPSGLLKAAALNLLNPNPYLGWSLVLGPMTLKAWGDRHLAAVILLAAFYSVMVLCLALTILLFGTTQWLGPKGRRALLLFSALALAALAVYEIAAGVA